MQSDAEPAIAALRHALPRDAVLRVSSEDLSAELKYAAARAKFAAEILAPEELEKFAAMKAAPTREAEWLLGRASAKSAVIEFLEVTASLRVTAAEVVIVADERGKPFPTGAWLREISEGVEISIAHSRGVAVAVAWGGGNGPAGLDLEFPRAMSDALIDRSFTTEELNLVGERGNALELWCLKEAAAKVTGDGIFQSLRDITVVSRTELRGGGRIFSAVVAPFRGGYLAVARLAR